MHSRSRIMMVLAALVGLVVGAGLNGSANSPAQAGPTSRVALTGTILAPEGTLLHCVFEYIGQGLTLIEAAKNCDVTVAAVPGGGDVSVGGGGWTALNGMRNTNGGGLTVTCPTSNGADPTISSGAKDVRDAAQAALNAFDKTHPYPTGADEGKRAELSTQLAEAQKKLNDETSSFEKREAAAKVTKKMLEDAANGTSSQPTPTTTPEEVVIPTPSTAPPETTPPPASTVPKPNSMPVSGADQACADFAAFVGECNTAGWATSPCQNLRRQLRGCKDMTMAYTTGDDPDAGCPPEKPDAETVARIVELHCGSDTKVAPGYDPCAPRELGGGPGTYRNASADPCSGKNPYALTTPDGCEVTVNSSTDFGLGPTIDPRVIILLGGPGLPNPPKPPTY